MTQSSSLPYVGPYVAFLLLLTLPLLAPLAPLLYQGGFVAAMLLIIAAAARRAPELRPANLRLGNALGSAAAGVAVFLIWIAPDRLFPGYRHHLLFENALTGTAAGGLAESARSQPAVVWLRAFRAVAIVPLVEEAFWRAWLMRWLIRQDFLAIPLGTWSVRSFWMVALLFAAEHGSYWDVGLAAGVIYNAWMLRTRSLGDAVLAHAVTNGCLSAYVVAAGRWEYWG